MLEIATWAWISLVGIQPLVLPWQGADSSPLLVDTLQLQRVEGEFEFRPLDISFPRVDAHELKSFDGALAVAPRDFANDDLKTPTF